MNAIVNFITTIFPSRISTHSDNPYKVQDNEEMQFLCESIQENGVLLFAIACSENRCSRGNMRLFPATAGSSPRHTSWSLTELPTVTTDLDRNAAAIALVDRLAQVPQYGFDTDSGGVQRYVRLTCLIPELLNKLDTGEMALSIGVELSYLNEQRRDVLEQCEISACTPSTQERFG